MMPRGQNAKIATESFTRNFRKCDEYWCSKILA